MLAQRLFLLGVAVIALHVIDDSFLQPQPGTSAVDHLVSGLVPLAFLGLAVWAFPRLRGGRQGALALVLGVLGLAAAGEAVHYAAGGDHFTGFASLGAGLLLLGVGVSTLWRTRRMDGHRFVRRALLGAAGLVVLAFGVVPVGMGYVEVHVARAAVPTPHLAAAHENITLTTSDGLKLRGWYVPSRNGAAVIAFPGRKGPQPHTRMRKWVAAPFKAVHTVAVATLSNRTPPPNLKTLAAKIAPRPLLLMYSGRGQGGEIELNPVFHRAAGSSSTLWKIPGAGHMGGIRAQPAEYERRVIAFFDAALSDVD